MDCERYRISCQLDRIADELTGFDVDAFLATLIATIVGAALALLGSWLLDKRRNKVDADELYRRRLDEALYLFIREAGERMHVLATSDAAPPPPPSALHAAASMARMVARDADAQATKQMQYAVDRIGKIPDSDRQRRQVEILGQVVRAWREGSHNATKATERFSGLEPVAAGSSSVK